MYEEKKELKGIKITVQREDRLQAITNLSAAINKVADALCACPQVDISHCIFNACSYDEAAINIEITDKVDRTEVIANE